VSPAFRGGRPLRATAYHWIADQLAPQIDAYTWHRYARIAPLLLRGPVRTLNVGTGGGIETLRLLGLGNHVTTIELDDAAARRTRERVVRAGFGDRHVGFAGHVMKVQLEETFDQIVMCEVLEHIQDDQGTLRRLSGWLKPGGRLVLSTPTAAHGVLPGDILSVVEDGGHVRPGYDGPELDSMLAQVGITTVSRTFLCGAGPTAQHILERRVRKRSAVLGSALGLASRPLMALLDAVPQRPSDQITVATKPAGG
jgi:2-polyprenyl-3-methyl-5-hydroxy-6-metoxy-1,4-benzoquinol methylase